MNHSDNPVKYKALTHSSISEMVQIPLPDMVMAKYSTNVLLIDPDKIISHAMMGLLIEAKDIELHNCSSREHAIQAAEHQGPTVIVQYMNTPCTEDMHLLSQLQRHEVTRHIPIIIVSAGEDASMKAEAFSLGADDFLVRLPDRIELIARIRYHTRAYATWLEREAAYLALEDSRAALARAHAELAKVSAIDDHTHVFNRRHFGSELDKEWLRSLRETLPLSVAILNVDHFTQYNDHYGHTAGDDCLKQIAQSLVTAVQRSTDLLARYGGEEFVVILPGTHAKGAIFMAEQLRHSILNLRLEHRPSALGQVSVSIGVATTTPNRKTNPNMLMKVADDMVEKAKREGRNQVSCGSL
ncbi:MAG: diguanylate cyclase [Mariprofundaceae bacterium]